MNLSRLALLLAPVLASCAGADLAATDADAPYTSDEASLTLTPAESAGVLRLVNDCATDRERLRGMAGVRPAPTDAILAARNGADATCGTADDRPFKSIAALDAVKGVGDAALRALLTYARSQGLVDGGAAGETPIGSFDGVLFTASEARGTLALANTATPDALDGDIGLDTRAADHITQARPFRTDDPSLGLLALSSVPYVGATALEALKAHATPINTPTPTPALICADLAGTFSGIEFSDGQAHDVLDLVSHGGPEALTSIQGMGPFMAGRIQLHQPYATLADLDAVPGVGPSLLRTLRDTVGLMWCATPAAHCGCDGVTPAEPVTPAPSTDAPAPPAPSTDAPAPPAPASQAAGPTRQAAITVEGVTFTAEAATQALDILQRAGQFQLEADGGFDDSDAGWLITRRPWTSVSNYAQADGVGPATLRILQAYATNGRWQGPGPMRTAVTVADLVAHPDRFAVNSLVSMERVQVRRTRATTSAQTISVADSADPGAPWVEVTDFLCGHDDCRPAPDLPVGTWLLVVRVDVWGYDTHGRPKMSTRPNSRLNVIP